MHQKSVHSINYKKTVCFLLVCLITILLAVYYCYIHSKVMVSSDSTTMLLLAKDFIHGNITLKDWVVGTNNFFFSETIFYCIAMIFGVSYQTVIMTITPIFLAVFMIFCCRMIWYQHMDSKQMRISACIASVMFLAATAFFPYALGYTYLNANSHNLLYLWIAIAVMCICQYDDRKKKGYLIAYVVIAVLMSFSEGVTLMVLLGPVIVVSAIQFLLEKDKRKQYGQLLIISGLSYIVAKIWLILLQHFGGLVVRGIPMSLVLSPRAVIDRMFQYSRALYCILGFGGLHTINLTSLNGVYSLIVFLCLCIFILGICVSIVMYLKLPLLDKLLLWMVILNFAGCFFTDVAIVARYMIPSVCFGFVLAFRMLTRIVNAVYSKIIIRIIVFVLCGGVIFAGGYRAAEYVRCGVYGENQKQLAELIQKEKLGDGYGDFWCASVNSYYTNFENDIYPVYIKDGKLFNYYELVNKQWYDEKNKHYIVTYSNDASDFFKNQDLFELLGNPDRSYECGTYQIFYWDKDISDFLNIEWS